jgi:hypothetical protein
VKRYLPAFLFFLFSLIGASLISAAQEEGEPLPCDVKRVGLDAAKFYIYITKDTPHVMGPLAREGQTLTGKRTAWCVPEDLFESRCTQLAHQS